ncbi:MAG TPA: TIM barrel protein [Solirubrobacteraceae bacterium]
MEATHASSSGAPAPIEARLAGAPISWGACEVPGWGVMPTPELVLGEMATLGLRGTELGPPGFLPEDPAQVSALLAKHDLTLVGGFVPLVLHESRADQAIEEARRAARLMSQAGAGMLVIAAVQDVQWSAPGELDDAAWRRLGEHCTTVASLASEYGMTVALHPHVGTLVETAEQVERALEVVEVGWCLDTGHLLIGGVDPVLFARANGERVVHVHLKDVDSALAADVRTGRRSLLDATRRGLFRALGQGDARIADVMDALKEHGYDGWLVLEQDTANQAPPSGAADRSTTGDEPTVAGGPMRDARRSIAFLHDTARTTEEINR